VFNNKGNPVRQFESFFSADHQFQFGMTVGVSRVQFYDPVARVIVTLRPDHTYEKVRFGAWRRLTYDAQDTLVKRGTETGDPRTDPDIKDFVAAYFAAQPPGWRTWHALRQSGTAAEQDAATKATTHADTPTTVHLDPLGRTFLTVAHNRYARGGTVIDEEYCTRDELDVEGNQRVVRDADQQNNDRLGRIIVRYDYDMLGNRVREIGMDAGERWTLNDVAGKAARGWDSRGHAFRTEYDTLRRPVRTFATGVDPADATDELLVERVVYGEQHPNAAPTRSRGRVYLHLDQAGAATNDTHDFKGNRERASRRLARQYTETIGWADVDALIPSDAATPFAAAALEAALAARVDGETYSSRTRFDALNRPVQVIAPRSDGANGRHNVIQSGYNEANLLQRVDVWLDVALEPAGLIDAGVTPPSSIGVSNIDYDAKGQRLRVDYKNGATTRLAYDRETFRLIHRFTRRGVAYAEDCGGEPPPPRFPAPDTPPASVPCGLQNIHYTHDAIGNITDIRDDAQPKIYFDGVAVAAHREYTYDAIYRLDSATGREHIGQVGQPETSWDDGPRVRRVHPHDGSAMREYIESYEYDSVGNIGAIHHLALNGSWTRAFTYAESSLVEPAKKNNRLSTTSVGRPNATDGSCRHDPHGNIIRLPHLANHADPAAPNMHWDYKDRLRQVDKGGGGTVYYTYGADGTRVRKVWEKSPGLTEERIYLAGFEIFRRRNGSGALQRERQTLHLMDQAKRLALVETRTLGVEPGVPQRLIRYQLGDHLDSASLELDDAAQIVSYEEHFPYGGTSHQAVRSQTETPKRYRYTGKERDEESGFCYYGARYYAPWLGRWISPDPGGVGASANLYRYTDDDPIGHTDEVGFVKVDKKKEVESEIGTRIVELFRDRSTDAEGKTFKQRVRGTGVGKGGTGVNVRLEPFGPKQKDAKDDPSYLKPDKGGHTYCVAATWSYAMKAIEQLNKERGEYSIGKIKPGDYTKLDRMQDLWYRDKTAAGTEHGGFGAPQAIVEAGLGYDLEDAGLTAEKDLEPGAVIQLFGGPTKGAPKHGKKGPKVDFGTSIIFLEYASERSLLDEIIDIWTDPDRGFFEKIGDTVGAIVNRIWSLFTGKGEKGINAIHQGKQQFYSFEELKIRQAKMANWYPLKPEAPKK
jgi:RHS repeat-associated protein